MQHAVRVSTLAVVSVSMHGAGMAHHLLLIDDDCLGCIIDKLLHGAEARTAAAVSLARTCT